MTRTRLCRTVALVWATLAIAPALAVAQEVGVKVGVNSTTDTLLEPKGTERLSRRTGFAGGLFYVQPFTTRLGLQTEALITVKGTKYQDLLPVETDIRVTYFEVPVLARFELMPAARVHLFTGPAFSVRLAAQSRVGTVTTEVTDKSLKKGTVGWAVGGGVQFGPAVADIRYTKGLLNVSKGTFPPAKNQAVTLMVGVRFSGE